jgi:hypothetical protein
MDPITIALIAGAIGNAAQGIFGNKQQGATYPEITDKGSWQDVWQYVQDEQNKQSLLNTSGQTNQEQAGEVTPTMSPQAQDFMNKLIGRFSEQAKPVDLTTIRQQGIRDINTSADAQRQAVENIMASRGLASSPVSGTSAAGVENQRIGSINRFESQMPFLQQDMDLTNLGAAANFFGQIPKGQITSQVGQTSNVGQQTGFDQTTGQTTTRNRTEGRDYTTQSAPPGSKGGGGNTGLGAGLGLAGGFGLGAILANLFGGGKKPTTIPGGDIDM